MANVNILEGMQCPQCKSDGPYRIRAHVLVLMDDDGTLDDLSGSEWDFDSQCECEACDYAGTVKDFLIEKKEAAD
jgi:hypothetical protein